MTSRVSAHLSRSGAGVPWGFRISGGRDFGAPVTVQRVVPGGVAERAGICAGDKLVEIAGSAASEMCHRDAQTAIKTAGNSLRLDVERDSNNCSKPVTTPIPSSSVTNELRNLEIRGTNVNPDESDTSHRAVNTTAQPWRPRKSIDSGSSASLSRVQPTSGFRPVSATLPQHNPTPAVVPSERKLSGPKPFQPQSAAVIETPAWKPSEDKNSNSSPLQDSGLRKTQEQSSLPRYQALMEPHDASPQWRKASAPNTSYRYQPSPETPGSLFHRGSDPAVMAHPQASSASLPPKWQRKGSDCTPAPFVSQFKPSPPTVAPKPPGDRRLSLERGMAPPFSQPQQTRPIVPKDPSPPPPPPQQQQVLAPSVSGMATPENEDKVAVSKEQKPGNNKTPAICYHCKEHIRGPYLMALDRYYCPDHFRCARCDAQLGKQPFISHEGAVYCLDDFRKYIAPRCAKCNEPVAEQQLLALDKVYHPHCFVCNMCKQPMADGSFRIGTDNLPYCDADWKANFQVICGRCDFPIEADEQFIDALSKSYHVDCFVCTTCHTKLEGKAFYLRNDQPYCRDHIQSS